MLSIHPQARTTPAVRREIAGSRDDILRLTQQPYVWSWCYPCGNCAPYEFIQKRIAAAGYKEPATFVLEHGYCRSVYVTDPNGMIVEFCRDDPRAAGRAPERRANAHAELARWLAGNHDTNNTYRSEAA